MKSIISNPGHSRALSLPNQLTKIGDRAAGTQPSGAIKNYNNKSTPWCAGPQSLPNQLTKKGNQAAGQEHHLAEKLRNIIYTVHKKKIKGEVTTQSADEERKKCDINTI